MDSRFTRFKFANTPRPPPPPPKDDIYQRPPTIGTAETPSSPLSPTAQYALRRANSPSPSPFSSAENSHTPLMNSSTPSLLSPPPDPNFNQSSASSSAGTRQTMLSTASKKDKALAFLKFPKRSPRTPPAVGTSSSAPTASVLVIGNPISAVDDDLPPPPQDDDGISLPWNFQHNIHVDEGYVGIPPSWSTSLASAGFTDDEIAAIQARRAIRSPPDLRYLYNERPQSPAGTTFPSAPILANPLPRSTSLRRLQPSASSSGSTSPDPASSPFPPRPVLPTIATSASTSSNASVGSGSSTPLSTRKPPPRRKPPSPLEADLVDEARNQAHKAKQASQSTMGFSEEFSGSSSNHSTTDNTANTSFAGLNNSVAYKYNPADVSSSSNNPTYTQHGAYATDTETDDDDTPLAHAPLRLGSESAFSTSSTLPGGIGRGQKAGGAGGASGFKVVNGGSTDGEGESGPGHMGGESGKSTEGVDLVDEISVEADAELELEVPERPKEKKSSIWGTKIGKPKSKEGSTSTHGSEGHTSSLGAPIIIAPAASTSALATAQTWKTSTSTSLASVVSRGGSFVDAMRGGVAKMTHRTPSGSDAGTPPTGVKKKKSGLASGLAASFRNRRAGTSAEGAAEDGEEEGEGEGSDEEFVSLPEESGPPVWEIYRRPRAGTDASGGTDGWGASRSTESLGRSALKRSASGRNGQPPPGVVGSDGQLLRKTSVHSQGSQSTPSLRLKSSKSGGSLRSLALGMGGRGAGAGHKKSGSTTSLESIPEASPPPLPTGAAARVGVAIANSSSSSPKSTTKKTAALPPRLSLHQYSGSSDLSAWSESLLSGISLSAAGNELGFGIGLDLNFGGDDDVKREKEPNSAPATATQSGGMTARPIALPAYARSQSQAESSTSGASSRAQQQPQPDPIVRTGTPSQRMRKAGQPLPSSKPPPQRPIPPIVVGHSNGGSLSSSTSSLPLSTAPTIPHPYAQAAAAGTRAATSAASSTHGRSRSNSRSRPPVQGHTANTSLSQSASSRDSPAPLSSVAEPATTARFPPPTPAFAVPPSTPLSATANLNKPLPLRKGSSDAATPLSARPPPSAAAGLLSPPPTAWSTAAEGVVSPAGSSAGPDSAQLWNEIEQMMDPSMMSSIPGLHLSVALPAGAQGVLRSAGLGLSHGHGQLPPPLSLPPVGLAGAAGANPARTVGDLVGESPTYSAAVTEAFSATLPFTPEEERMEAQRKLRASEGVLGTKSPLVEQKAPAQLMGIDEDEIDEDDDGEGSSSEYSDEENPYGAYDSHQGQSQLGLRPRSPSRERGDGRLLTVSHTRERDPNYLRGRDTNRDSSQSNSSTLTVTALAAPAVVQNVSVARRASAYVIDKRNVHHSRDSESSAPSPTTPLPASGLGLSNESKPLPSSPLSSHFGGTGSEESGSTGSVSSSSQEQELHPTPTTDGGIGSPLFYYLDGTQTPSPTPDKMLFDQRDRMPNMHAHAHANLKDDQDDAQFPGYPDEETMAAEAAAAAAITATTPSPNATRPTIIISDAPLSGGGTMPLTTSVSTPGTSTPLSPFQRYRGWLSAVVAPLEEFIDEAVDPRDHYLDMKEIAEGESGSVFAATLNPVTAAKLRLPPLIKAKDADEIMAGRTVMVAIKSVAIVPSGSPKLVDLQRELTLMRGLWHDNVLGMDGVYVDLQEDSLWVRMELMERSLADIIGLVGDGLQLQERTIARFASDVLCALEYLQRHNIAHRDVRSDNLLLNTNGILKLADFSNAVQVTQESPMRSDIVGVAYWQAPEVRRPPYDALKVDVWSLGATIWEMAQQDPPFVDTQQLADRWPPLRQPELFSPAFHDFLRRCSEPSAVRPSPSELLKSSLIVNKACGRQVIVLLLSQCLAMEKALQEENAET